MFGPLEELKKRRCALSDEREALLERLHVAQGAKACYSAGKPTRTRKLLAHLARDFSGLKSSTRSGASAPHQ